MTRGSCMTHNYSMRANSHHRHFDHSTQSPCRNRPSLPHQHQRRPNSLTRLSRPSPPVRSMSDPRSSETPLEERQSQERWLMPSPRSTASACRAPLVLVAIIRLPRHALELPARDTGIPCRQTSPGRHRSRARVLHRHPTSVQPQACESSTMRSLINRCRLQTLDESTKVIRQNAVGLNRAPSVSGIGTVGESLPLKLDLA